MWGQTSYYHARAPSKQCRRREGVEETGHATADVPGKVADGRTVRIPCSAKPAKSCFDECLRHELRHAQESFFDLTRVGNDDLRARGDRKERREAALAVDVTWRVPSRACTRRWSRVPFRVRLVFGIFHGGKSGAIRAFDEDVARRTKHADTLFLAVRV